MVTALVYISGRTSCVPWIFIRNYSNYSHWFDRSSSLPSGVKGLFHLPFNMPQWVQLPPNLVPEKHTLGKSIYMTDYSSKRPGFQLHLQKARGFQGSRHHPPVPKVWWHFVSVHYIANGTTLIEDCIPKNQLLFWTSEVFTNWHQTRCLLRILLLYGFNTKHCTLICHLPELLKIDRQGIYLWESITKHNHLRFVSETRQKNHTSVTNRQLSRF